MISDDVDDGSGQEERRVGRQRDLGVAWMNETARRLVVTHQFRHFDNTRRRHRIRRSGTVTRLLVGMTTGRLAVAADDTTGNNLPLRTNSETVLKDTSQQLSHR